MTPSAESFGGRAEEKAKVSVLFFNKKTRKKIQEFALCFPC